VGKTWFQSLLFANSNLYRYAAVYQLGSGHDELVKSGGLPFNKPEVGLLQLLHPVVDLYKVVKKLGFKVLLFEFQRVVVPLRVGYPRGAGQAGGGVRGVPGRDPRHHGGGGGGRVPAGVRRVPRAVEGRRRRRETRVRAERGERRER
jgi:hypothetical protein